MFVVHAVSFWGLWSGVADQLERLPLCLLVDYVDRGRRFRGMYPKGVRNSHRGKTVRVLPKRALTEWRNPLVDVPAAH
jgi:hypothetical protein